MSVKILSKEVYRFSTGRGHSFSDLSMPSDSVTNNSEAGVICVKLINLPWSLTWSVHRYSQNGVLIA